jgi:hypothetical protein
MQRSIKTKAQQEVPILTAESPDGRSVQVTPDQGTDLIFVATWCGFSKQLINILNDPRTQPYLANRKLIFIFEKSEWPTLESEVIKGAKSGNYSEDDVPGNLAQMQRQSGSPRVVYPSFLNNLPGQYFFCTVPDEAKGFPTVLTVHGYSNSLEWLVQERNMPAELAHKVSDDYDPIKRSSS